MKEIAYGVWYQSGFFSNGHFAMQAAVIFQLDDTTGSVRNMMCCPFPWGVKHNPFLTNLILLAGRSGRQRVLSRLGVSLAKDCFISLLRLLQSLSPQAPDTAEHRHLKKEGRYVPKPSSFTSLYCLCSIALIYAQYTPTSAAFQQSPASFFPPSDNSITKWLFNIWKWENLTIHTQKYPVILYWPNSIFICIPEIVRAAFVIFCFPFILF